MSASAKKATAARGYLLVHSARRKLKIALRRLYLTPLFVLYAAMGNGLLSSVNTLSIRRLHNATGTK